MVPLRGYRRLWGRWFVLLVGLSLVGACQSDAPETDTNADASAPSSQEATVAQRDTITLTGTLLDATCHAQSEQDATDGAPLDCEGDYVAKGYPVGLRTGGADEVWLLSTVPQALADYLTSTARITGVVRSEGVLIPHEVEIRDGSTWVTVM